MYTYTAIQLQHKTFVELKAIARDSDIVPTGDRRCRQNWIDALVGINLPLLQLLETSPGVEVDQVQERKEISGFDSDRVQERKEISGFDSDRVQERKEISGLQAEQVQEAIAPAAKISPGVTFFDRFLACYSPPQPDIFYKPDGDGQLNLLDFEVESVDEPPDPDDFSSIDVFQEAMALWDAENPEPFTVSMDSMCEWAPCSDSWYEPDILLEVSEVLELSIDRLLVQLMWIGETKKCCPCGAMPAAQCDGTTAIHIYPDRIVFTPCYKSDLFRAQLLVDRVRSRSPPGGDAMF